MNETSDLWRPLRTPIFRQLLIADVASDIGTFMQSVGAAWLMVSHGAGPLFVALTQTASTLPFFVFALPAGAIGDIVDRRKLILYTEGVDDVRRDRARGHDAPRRHHAVAAPRADVRAVGRRRDRDADVAGGAARARAREDLAAASALNGIEFNIARAVGPALAGGLIAVAGVGAAFVVNVASFAGVILVIARWKRPVRVRTAPAESIGGATVAALRYIRYAPTARGLMLRAGAVMFCASAPFALLPTVAHRVSGDAIGYGLLLGCFGSARSLGRS